MLTRPIADELEIRSLVHRYADAASRRDPPQSQALSRTTVSGTLPNWAVTRAAMR